MSQLTETVSDLIENNTTILDVLYLELDNPLNRIIHREEIASHLKKMCRECAHINISCDCIGINNVFLEKELITQDESYLIFSVVYKVSDKWRHNRTIHLTKISQKDEFSDRESLLDYTVNDESVFSAPWFNRDPFIRYQFLNFIKFVNRSNNSNRNVNFNREIIIHFIGESYSQIPSKVRSSYCARICYLFLKLIKENLIEKSDSSSGYSLTKKGDELVAIDAG